MSTRAIRLLATQTLGTHLEKRKQFHQVNQAFRLLTFSLAQRLPAILSIQQLLKARLDCLRHVKTCEIIGYFHFQLNCVAHRQSLS